MLYFIHCIYFLQILIIFLSQNNCNNWAGFIKAYVHVPIKFKVGIKKILALSLTWRELKASNSSVSSADILLGLRLIIFAIYLPYSKNREVIIEKCFKSYMINTHSDLYIICELLIK